jgi:hypothetical protein
MSSELLNALRHENNPVTEVPEVYSVPVWELPFDVTEGYTGYGVPEELLPEVTDVLLKTIKQAGLDPDNLVLSGYDGEPHDKHLDFAAETIIDEKIRALGRAATRLQTEGAFKLNPQKAEKYKQKIHDLKQEKQRIAHHHEYFFADPMNLLSSKELSSNPIHYAGIGQRATIAVYDKAALLAFDENLSGHGNVPTGDVWSFVAAPEDVDDALVMVFHPRYVDGHGKPINS